MAPASRSTFVNRTLIDSGWELCATSASACSSPEQLRHAGKAQAWQAIPAAMTVAAALRALGQWSLDGTPRRFDADDWWYRVDIDVDQRLLAAPLFMGFDGLAGACEVWLNDKPLLRSTSMYVQHEVDVTALVVPGRNTLALRFESLDAWLAQRRARPRWRAPMVEHQQMRWTRNTLLGRTPGWSPPVAAVGPWRDIWLESRRTIGVASVQLLPSVTTEGTGVLALACTLSAPEGTHVTGVDVELENAGKRHRVRLAPGSQGSLSFGGQVEVPGAALWWPHTHGKPTLYAARLWVHGEGGAEPSEVPLRSVGFRTITVDTHDGGFALSVNGVPIFCRGACWTPLDVVTLHAEASAYRDAVAQARDAGMNMLRVTGTMVYEAPAFFDACDALGVLVWQDFMFANMDYPADDAGFMRDVQLEVQQQLQAWQGRASLAVVCGNSEVEQQAAMWGAARELWQPALFHETLRGWVEQAMPDAVYWPSSAHGGGFPHQASSGTCSYYGVGGYLRPLADARRAQPRCATECLAFANVPDEATIARMPGGAGMRVHQPAWKARSPRDLGAGWDFDDVRDHYLADHYGMDPVASRRADHERYLAASRVLTGDVMAQAFGEWRREGSRCGGALVLFLRDLWAGAGWGVLDDKGNAKPCFYPLKRALQPVAVSLSDEGGNGLSAHIVNEHPVTLQAALAARLFSPSGALLGQCERPVELRARAGMVWDLAEGFEHFHDLSYAYRFGPLPIALVHLQLKRADDAVLAETFFLPGGAGPGAPQDIGLSASLQSTADGASVRVSSRAFAHSVAIEVDGHEPVDNHFHLAPGDERCIALKKIPARASGLAGQNRVGALNSDRSVHLSWPAK